MINFFSTLEKFQSVEYIGTEKSNVKYHKWNYNRPLVSVGFTLQIHMSSRLCSHDTTYRLKLKIIYLLVILSRATQVGNTKVELKPLLFANFKIWLWITVRSLGSKHTLGVEFTFSKLSDTYVITTFLLKIIHYKRSYPISLDRHLCAHFILWHYSIFWK